MTNEPASAPHGGDAHAASARRVGLRSALGLVLASVPIVLLVIAAVRLGGGAAPERSGGAGAVGSETRARGSAPRAAPSAPSEGSSLGPSSLSDDEIAGLDAVDLERELAAGRLSAVRVTAVFLARIAALDSAGPKLGAVIEVNPDALAIARELDARRVDAGPVGPLHGVPVLVKANIDTADRMATSAGSLALAQHRAARDAPIVARLRAAGAVLLGKTNLSEWANFRSTRSTSGWSSLGGQTRNPYVLDRTPCGSSSGSAVAIAARLAPLAVGTETDGSIVCPAAANGVVGIKPTLGRVAGDGIVPIARSQDTAGPLARSVRDADLLLAVLEGLTPRAGSLAPHAGRASAPRAPSSAALRGARIGVVRAYAGAGRDAPLEAAYTGWLAALRAGGAELVDPVDVTAGPDVEEAELVVLLHEFHVQIDEYLAHVSAGPRSLAELIAFDDAHAAEVMPLFGQELLLAAQQTTGLDAQRYRDAVATLARFRERLAAQFASASLEALVAPIASRAWRVDPAAGDGFSVASATIAAVSGYPSVAVPAQMIDELPVGMALIGKPDGEERLVAIAAAFEAARDPLPPPRFLQTIGE